MKLGDAFLSLNMWLNPEDARFLNDVTETGRCLSLNYLAETSIMKVSSKLEL